MKAHVVFDTTVVVSALVFSHGHLAWLREHWRERHCVPLLSRSTAAELMRALEYPQFQLSAAQRRELLGQYLPYCELLEEPRARKIICRDTADQQFLDLAQGANCSLLVTGDKDLLVLAGKTRFHIETPQAYRARSTAA